MKKQIMLFALLPVTSYGALTFVDTSAIRALPESDWNEWDVFTIPNAGPNFGDINIGSGATVTQTNLTPPGALVTSGGNIYSPATVLSFEIADLNPSYVNPGTGTYIGNIVLQFSTLGVPFDPNSLVLMYTDDSSATGTLAAFGSSKETTTATVVTPGGLFVSTNEEVAYQWDLTGLNAVSYEIVFGAAGSSMSLDQLVLDTASSNSPFVQVVPAAGAGAGAGAVPEPGSAMLVALAAGGLLLRRNRSKG